MHLKKIATFATNAILLTGLTVGGLALHAQDSAPPPDTASQGPGGPRHHHRMDPDRMMARMTKRYSLSQDQQSQIKPILESQMQQMKALHDDTSLSRQDRWAKMQSIHSDSNAKIEAVLNDSQKDKFEKDQQRRQMKMQQKMQERQGSTEPAPPPQQ